MHALSAPQLLSVWECGNQLSAPRRAQLLLATATPQAGQEELARLPVGQRDDLLLALRAAAFGQCIEATAACPHCGEALEMGFDISDLRTAGDWDPDATFTLECEGHLLTFRLPDCSDLIELSDLPDLEQAESELLRRCVLSARAGGHELTPDALSAPVVRALADRLAEADPQADVRLALACPACAHHWQEPFDIVSFFWREIESWALRLLRDVHTLASAYGWSEAEILALSPARRRIYLELVVA